MAINPNKTRSENALSNLTLQERHSWFVEACKKDDTVTTVYTIVLPSDGVPLDNRKHGLHVWDKDGDTVPELLDNSQSLHSNVLQFKNKWRAFALLYKNALQVSLPQSFLSAFKEGGLAWYLLTKRSFNDYAQQFANYIHRTTAPPDLPRDVENDE